MPISQGLTRTSCSCSCSCSCFSSCSCSCSSSCSSSCSCSYSDPPRWQTQSPQSLQRKSQRKGSLQSCPTMYLSRWGQAWHFRLPDFLLSLRLTPTLTSWTTPPLETSSWGPPPSPPASGPASYGGVRVAVNTPPPPGTSPPTVRPLRHHSAQAQPDRPAGGQRGGGRSLPPLLHIDTARPRLLWAGSGQPDQGEGR